MNKLNPKDYIHSIPYIDELGCGIVYPHSIAEMVQPGDIFTSTHWALFWHYSGFAFAYGDYDENSLDWIYETFLSDKCTTSRRFILFLSNEQAATYFSKKENIVLGHRYFFEYPKKNSSVLPALPADYELCEINNELLDKIHGNITPFFSWNNADEFLKNGKGYCIIERENVAAWAFSAAISKEEIDIGIETNAGYQHLGLGTIVAERMIQYSLNQNKRPVWACSSDNIASQRLAYKLGFVKSTECYTIKRR